MRLEGLGKLKKVDDAMGSFALNFPAQPTTLKRVLAVLWHETQIDLVHS
jgi:hypothetical protein